MATILVIDDEAPIPAFLSRRFCNPPGHEMVEASSGREGLWLYRQRAADVVIVDLLMPELSRLDTILKFTPRIPEC
jgi:CheY-like chemotaxis protein